MFTIVQSMRESIKHKMLKKKQKDAPDINMLTNVFFLVVCILLNQIPAPQMMNPDDFLQTVFLWECCTNIRCPTTLILYGKTSSLTTDYVFFLLESMESSRNTQITHVNIRHDLLVSLVEQNLLQEWLKVCSHLCG